MPIIAIMGPTASGKSALITQLAEHHAIEIISVDSAQIYRGLDIGTAKPSPEEQQRIPHHLIDICDPSETYSVAQFLDDTHQAIQAIQHRGRMPVLVGGTMMYHRALQFGLSTLPSAEPGVRASISDEAAEQGWPAMHQRLARIDPATAAHIHPNDAQRIQRALEVYVVTGQTLSQLQAMSPVGQQCDILPMAITVADRAVLHQRISDRFDLMLQQGFVTEVAALFARADLHSGLPSIRSVGYRQVWEHLAGEYDEDTMRLRAIAATRQLAKRQLTWLRRWPDCHPLEMSSPNLIGTLLKYIEKNQHAD